MRALHKERPALGAGMACACLAALCLGGCSLAPKYERPDAPVAVYGREAGSGTRGAFVEAVGVVDRCVYTNL